MLLYINSLHKAVHLTAAANLYDLIKYMQNIVTVYFVCESGFLCNSIRRRHNFIDTFCDLDGAVYLSTYTYLCMLITKVQVLTLCIAAEMYIHTFNISFMASHSYHAG